MYVQVAQKAMKAWSVVHEVKETNKKAADYFLFLVVGDYLGQKEQWRIS